MKRSEIKAGDELYYDPSTGWQVYGPGRKAIVIDAQPYSITRRDWGKDTYRPDPKGKAVLVKVLTDPDAGDGFETAVPIAHLRGPYEQTKADVETSVAEARERRQAESKRRQDAWAEARAAEESAREAGIAAQTAQHFGKPVIQVPVADFIKLLDAFRTR